MTKKEAIHFAECLKNNWTIDFNDMEIFCDMVIEALQEENPNDYKPILTEEEKCEILYAIGKAIPGYQVMGCEDTDGLVFKVLINKDSLWVYESPIGCQCCKYERYANRICKNCSRMYIDRYVRGVM